VKLVTRNAAMGGMGTLPLAMCGKTVYGDDADMMLWDSMMTEKDPGFLQFFWRNAVMSGDKPSFLVYASADSGKSTSSMLPYHRDFGVGVAHSLNANIAADSPLVTSEEQALTIPQSIRYNNCALDNKKLCSAHKFNANCWVEREDFKPEKKQGAVSGQVSWHPGWKEHKVRRM
jgi:hypothetical protein